ncbi:transcriptional regulator [Nitrosopumilus cobalaminigenes]|uniref:Transcriptional regulator n=1 Tax=Nitrosopumilus cobalaminigenes TaxID=1470066 RepID=A0A7D5M1G6_9ARCH|nr:transcriptional regulator [Nitrosopumilus cobalaminigenes]QLH03571.1 transcriptional regulator [Nitrosopumilus cobalaminigenes]
MGGIDRMIASALSSEIKKELDLDILKKTERELFLEHGMSIKLSIEHFHKFSSVLRKNSSIDVKKFEKDCIGKILKIKKKDDKFLVTIINSDLRDLILELFGEVETRKIISSLLENEYTIPQILKESKVPKTSGYRKIENLILHGLIIESGKVLSESKKISKLQCVFQEMKLDIKKEKIGVIGVVNKKMFEKSTSMKVIIESLE